MGLDVGQYRVFRVSSWTENEPYENLGEYGGHTYLFIKVKIRMVRHPKGGGTLW